MKSFKITQTKTGLDLGIYQAETGEDAIRAMLEDAGEPDETPDEGLVAEEVDEATVTVTIDYENNSEIFWDTARAAYPALMERIVRGEYDVAITEEELEALMAIEGWDDGPKCAPNPLIVKRH